MRWIGPVYRGGPMLGGGLGVNVPRPQNTEVGISFRRSVSVGGGGEVGAG